MKYCIGVVPPENIYQTILNIQRQFGDNRLEPHITLRPPVTVTDLAEWVKAIEDVCSDFDPFNISLPSTDRFGSRVLFIDVKSKALENLHNHVGNLVKPFEQANNRQPDQRSFNPHLTLGRSWCGFTQQNFEAMKILAEEFLSKKLVAFEVKFLRLYHKPHSGGRYELLKDIQLGKGIDKKVP